MTYEINGQTGAYDGQIKDESIKYGRNAANNNKQLAISPIINDIAGTAPILDFSPSQDTFDSNCAKVEEFAENNDKQLQSLPPLEYEYRYMPNITKGSIDKKALLGASFEELGDAAVKVEKFEENFLPDKENMTAKPLDINNDGYIDAGEYGSTILAADMLSKESQVPEEIDGSINTKGLNAVMEYTQKSNADAAAKLYSNLYSKFDLGNIE